MLKYLFRSLLLVVVSLPLVALAATLGEARVKSFLNQPLDVEIDLIGLSPGQHQDVRVRVANQVHFDRLGIVYEHFLNDLQFDVVGSDDSWMVRARSTRPIAEPFIDFPLQMSWPGGQLVKQYTLLLDPPTRIQKATRTPRRSVETQPAAKAPAAPATPVADDSYGPVERGETLWPIAERLRPRGITTRQMAMALLRANPQAFIDGNINMLRTGAVLAVPPLAFIQELDAATARREFAAHTQRRQPPLSASPRPTAPTAAQTAVVAPNDVTIDDSATPATGQDSSAEEEANAQLRIVTDDGTPDSEGNNERALKDRLLVTMEEIESNRITTDAIESRLSRLEGELSRMQQLVELKDAQIAALQSEVRAREAIERAAALAEPTPPPPALVAGAPATTQVAPAPTPVATIEAAPITPVDAEASSPWYRDYLWIVWAVLGLLGLSAILLMVRRQSTADGDVLMAELPSAAPATGQPHATPRAPSTEALREARRDLDGTSPTGIDLATEEIEETADLPELSARDKAEADQRIEGLTNSLLDEMLADGKHLEQGTAPQNDQVILDTDLGDDDIDAWVEEIDNEVERINARSANDERLELDDDIPSILTELNDQLSASDTSISPEPVPIELDPIDEITEDDAFSMSLDLARAYLEIGDQEGARDMLKQALGSAKDPQHRQQIEELLGQID
jgi:pilus assembly protein FimV